MPLAVARESSVRLVDEAASTGKLIGVFTQRDPTVEEPGLTICSRRHGPHIHKMFKLPDGSSVSSRRAWCGCVSRTSSRRGVPARQGVRGARDPARRGPLEIDALQRNIKTNFQQVVSLSPLLSDDLQTLAGNITDPPSWPISSRRACRR